MESKYDRAVLDMLDEDATWPTLPDNISRKRGAPEAYFERFMRGYIADTRRALDELEAALAQPGGYGWEVEAFEELQEAIVGVQVAVRGRELLGLAATADGLPPIDTVLH